MYTFDQFKKSRWAAVVLFEEKIIFRSRAKGLKPLIRFIKENPIPPTDCVIYDRYVGRAAALLMTMIKPRLVCTPVISEGGKAVLTEVSIDYKADKTVRLLMGLASADMCQWEKLSLGKTAKEFWESLT